MIYSKDDNEKGVILLLTLLVLMIICAVTVSFLYMTSIQTKVSGTDIVDSQAFWIAEAGMQKAVWNLMTPIGSGGQGENWTTSGVTESLGNGSYTFQVEKWDWALQSHNAAVSAFSSETTGFEAVNVNDGNDTTYWKPTTDTAYIVIAFPYTLKINKARILALQHPVNYNWEVSADMVSYTTALTVLSNNDSARTDEFHPAQTNANYLKLSILDTTGSTAVIATLEVLGSKITSTGTVDGLSRSVEQTAAIDDGDTTVYTPTAYDQIDWKEIP